MADYAKVSGINAANVTKCNSAERPAVAKISGASSPNIAQASKWIVGANSGKVWKTTATNASYSWSEIADWGHEAIHGVAIGEDAAGDKRWFIHKQQAIEDVAYCADGSEDDIGNWTAINVDHQLTPVNGNTSICWGNGYWVAAADPTDNTAEIPILASSDGGNTWAGVAVDVGAEDKCRAMCYKSGTTFFFSIQDKIWKATANPTVAGNWSQVIELSDSSAHDIYSMAYDGDGRWVCVGSNATIYTSDDDWSSATSRSNPFGSTTISAVAYVAGTINKWVAAGHSGKLATSPDGETWTLRDIPHSNNIRGVATDNITIAACGGNGKLVTSIDGISWALVPGLSGSLNTIACDIIGVGMR